MIASQVAFALRLIDDFNGKTIKNQKFNFELDGIVVRPIQKEEGLYVFSEPVKRSVELRIISRYYHTDTVSIEKEKLDQKEPVAEVRLYGKSGQGHFGVCGFHCGKIEDKRIAYPVLVCAKSSKDTGLTWKELRQEKGETYLLCNGFTKETIVGKTFCITSEKKTDIFVILEKKGVNGYRISGKISRSHKPGTPIERVYRSLSDENGYYSIPVNEDEQDKITEVIIL